MSMLSKSFSGNDDSHPLVVNRERALRSSSGFQLVEMMVAVTCLAFFLGFMMDGLAQIHQQGNAGQNQVIAFNLIQQIFDRARNQTYTTLTANADGNFHSIPIYNTLQNPFAQPANPSYIQTPLMCDFQNGFTYSGAGQSNLFRGTAQQMLLANPDNTVTLTATVQWPGENGGNQKTMTMSTIIAQSGLHYR